MDYVVRGHGEVAFADLLDVLEHGGSRAGLAGLAYRQDGGHIAYYPTSTDVSLTGWRRFVLRSASAWRYHLRFYDYPVELRALHKLIAYQRPETSGF